jgi:hypothetical protein
MPPLSATLDKVPIGRNETGESTVPHANANGDEADRRRYLSLLADACSRSPYDSSLLQWALGLGLDLYVQRSVYFDGLVRAERLQRGMDPRAESPWTAQPQPSANQRGIDLLLENLTARQREQYRARQHFDVIGGQSGKRYRIWRRPYPNVEELDAYGQRAYIWCFQPKGALVLGDVLLAQKTALELFECDAIKIANRYPRIPRIPDAACAQSVYCRFANA